MVSLQQQSPQFFTLSNDLAEGHYKPSSCLADSTNPQSTASYILAFVLSFD